MPKKTKVTTRDIAKQCGISQTTVSMILSNKPGIQFSEDTIKKVQNTASTMGYVYKPRIMKKDNSAKKSILIMCPSLSSQYYTTLIQAITLSAKTKGLYTITGYTMREKAMEEYYLKMAVESEFYGIIYTYAPKAVDTINALVKKHPFVLINDYHPELHVPLLELDSKKSGFIVGQHLLSLGHQDIAYLCTPLNKNEIPRIQRLEGLRQAFSQAGLDRERVRSVELTNNEWDNYLLGNRYYDAGYHLTMQFFQNQPPKEIQEITAFVGTNDMISIGIIDALKKLGYSVPKDYSVCGFDNTLESTFAGISLTSLDHSMDEKGKAAIDMLIKQKDDFNNHVDSDKIPIMRMEYEPKLQIRNSTGKARTSR